MDNALDQDMIFDMLADTSVAQIVLDTIEKNHIRRQALLPQIDLHRVYQEAKEASRYRVTSNKIKEHENIRHSIRNELLGKINEKFPNNPHSSFAMMWLRLETDRIFDEYLKNLDNE